MSDLFNSIWDMMKTVGFSVNDIFVSLASIFEFSIFGTLFVCFIVWLLGGND